MTVLLPLPRFRIYTTLRTYMSGFRELFTGTYKDKPEDITAFENAVKQYVGRKHAIAMPTARTGIYLTIKAIIKPGQKVIMAPITIVDVINMVLSAGGVPVFADTEPDSCNIDPDEIEKLIDSDTGLVFVTHLHGLACNMDRIEEICRRKNVPLVEDSAQAF